MKKQNEIIVEGGKFVKDSTGWHFVQKPKVEARKSKRVSLDDNCNESCYENSYEGE